MRVTLTLEVDVPANAACIAVEPDGTIYAYTGEVDCGRWTWKRGGKMMNCLVTNWRELYREANQMEWTDKDDDAEAEARAEKEDG